MCSAMIIRLRNVKAAKLGCLQMLNGNFTCTFWGWSYDTEAFYGLKLAALNT